MKTTILTAETIATLDENDRLRAERIARRKAQLKAQSKKQKIREKRERAQLALRQTPASVTPEIRLLQSTKWIQQEAI